MRARNPRDEERVIDGMDRVPSLKQHLIERAMLCTCAIFFFFLGGSEDVGNLEGGVSDRISFELFPDRILQEACHRMVQRNS